jgi:nicotinamide N-methyltransferase
MAHLPESERAQGFHTLILADLLFNHSEHEKLVKSIRETLRRGPECVALVFFTPYRPWLLMKDMDFFRLANENGFKVNPVLEKIMEKVLFEKDRGVSTTLVCICDIVTV